MASNRGVDLSLLLEAIGEFPASIQRGTATFTLLEHISKGIVKESGLSKGAPVDLGPFGTVIIPLHEMGAVTSLDLFGLDELVLFCMYASRRDQYRFVADLGANIGLHSILMSRLGWRVNSYEADPATADVLEANLSINDVSTVTVHRAAVAQEDGEATFTRVLGNLTGSHLAGDKAQPYGQLESFPVKCTAISPIMRSSDLVKMDIEGSEARVVEATGAEDWDSVDVVMEVGSRDNALRVFTHLQDLGVRMYAQKIGWLPCRTAADLPSHHTEGSLFCTYGPGPFGS